jgi:hypothetical protein
VPFDEPKEWEGLQCGSKSLRRLQGYTNTIQDSMV